MQNNIAFLSADVSRLIRKRFDLAARALGVTGPQWRVLAALERTPGMNQCALAAWLEVEAITAGRMIDRLEKAGFVERRPDPADRRVWRLYLTAAADPQMAHLRACADDVFAEALHGLGEDEHQMLLALLGRVRTNLLENSPGDAAVAAAE
ncbi:MarR family winged helix-turn-helix transcriptional regulator [Novosphingobium huizhouense]|uniref:MarR family winged helix-turn-helix transcriptional regulator n=1 Tax=Novosphingobium huizhouense TaxID=2866625 RepID=UPI001CD8B978|nr:MarR family transcriptional regulator [Novosphingobium huizhouense]